MKNLKKIMIVIIFIILIILIILLNLIKTLKEKEEPEVKEPEVDTSQTVVDNKEEDKTRDEKLEYLRVYACLNQYTGVLNVKNPLYYTGDGSEQLVDDKTIYQNIINMLSENYVKKNSIKTSNVKDYIYKIEKESSYTPVSIELKAETENTKSYLIKGVILDWEYKNKIDSYLILNIDEKNKTFSVEPLASEKDFKNAKVSKVESVKNNSNNIYRDLNNSEKDLLQKYILNYKTLALGAPDVLYNNFLDDEYKKARFGSAEKYKKYVEANKDNIRALTANEYTSTEVGEYTQYMIVDHKEKTYFFNVKNPMEYKIILDYYTVDMAQFKESYEKGTDKEKVGYNVNKIFDAINDTNYSYVYNKLDENFKKNNYPTQESFEKAIKEILFAKNEISNFSCTDEGDVYQANLIVNNKEKAGQSKKFTCIMMLKEGTDFVMSFNVE